MQCNGRGPSPRHAPRSFHKVRLCCTHCYSHVSLNQHYSFMHNFVLVCGDDALGLSRTPLLFTLALPAGDADVYPSREHAADVPLKLAKLSIGRWLMYERRHSVRSKDTTQAFLEWYSRCMLYVAKNRQCIAGVGVESYTARG